MKDKNVAAILALFMGFLGVHKFYLGKIGSGMLYLILGIFSFALIPALLGMVDFFVLALMDKDEFDRRHNGVNMLPGPVVVNMLPPAGMYGPGYAPPPPPGYGYGVQTPYGPGYAPPPAGPPQQPVGAGRDVEQLKVELEKLNELRISGLLTEEEFAQQKSRLLGT